MQRKPHVVFILTILAVCVAAGGCDKLRARDKLNKGVSAYKNAQFDVAIEDFKQSRELDPTLTNAQLYLATAYASQYIPGAPSEENVRNGDEAIKEFKDILTNDPNNLSAIDGVGSILYNMATTPFDPDKLQESKSYHLKHIQFSPSDPEPYYWIGVIDWTLAYRGNKDMREEFNGANAKKAVKEGDPMPPALTTQFAQKYNTQIDEGITDLKKAIELKPDYDDAMAYLNLLERQKADTEAVASARDEDLKAADDLVDRVKAIKQKKMESASPNS